MKNKYILALVPLLGLVACGTINNEINSSNDKNQIQIGTNPEKKNFLERNRIIAGLSDGIIVTEAKEVSGTMNTVCHALENGKQIFCVPDRLFNNSGCNKLIKEGAKLIENGDDVLEEFKNI